MEYWGSRKKDTEKRRLGDPEKNDLFLPISVSPYHPIRILTHYSTIPSFHRSNGFGSSFNVHRRNETDVITVADGRKLYFLSRWSLEVSYG